ncbi:hypothetical protein KFE98_20290 [bacterium SCSIO 12741]|nr:hypothetical protein KFE98_20290 [bacterium SCSIO 12741]
MLGIAAPITLPLYFDEGLTILEAPVLALIAVGVVWVYVLMKKRKYVFSDEINAREFPVELSKDVLQQPQALAHPPGRLPFTQYSLLQLIGSIFLWTFLILASWFIIWV